jgi:hypothetical protein
MLGFFLTRHVTSEKTNEYWKNCIRCIRQNYPKNIIIIIDDNSNNDYLNSDDINLEYCMLIKSEFPKRGEMLPYYYFYQTKLFDKAIIIHDSFYLKEKIDVTHINDVKFLFHFDNNLEDEEYEKLLLSKLKYSEELLQLYNTPNSWKGCFGVMSLISYEFLKTIVEKYDIFNLLDHIKTRIHRCCLERVFAIVCCNEKKDLIHNISIFGHFLQLLYSSVEETRFNKIFTGR